jgi:hypothetical protein
MSIDGDALARWADFPVSVTPRPLVLMDGYVRVGPSGFLGGQEKVAFISGAIDSRTELPDGVVALLAPHSDHPLRVSGRRITITAISRTEAPFRTDRGLQLLSAYALDCDGTHEPVVVLDPATPVWWPERPTPESTGGTSATIETDGVTLHVLALGGVVTEFLGCEFSESDTAVLARPVTRERNPEGRPVRGVGVHRQVSGRLSTPLGPRVLIDTDGSPIEVQPA